jgi:hypothetical protein
MSPPAKDFTPVGTAVTVLQPVNTLCWEEKKGNGNVRRAIVSTFHTIEMAETLRTDVGNTYCHTGASVYIPSPDIPRIILTIQKLFPGVMSAAGMTLQMAMINPKQLSVRMLANSTMWPE